MATINYVEEITKFNGDKEIIALREKYKEPTFFEIISKQRSENTYSSFLKWMFQSSSTDLNSVSPILLLLDILVKRSTEKAKIDDEFKKNILTRNFRINSIEVETEKSVGLLADELRGSHGSAGELSLDEEKNIIGKCKDRIDIYIKCVLDNDEEVQIIIENKIDSIEGKAKQRAITGVEKYDKNADQTKRYYLATHRNTRNNLKQLYVYLSPFENANPACEHFIPITYQDIIDGIIVPMLSSNSLSTRARFFLEEVKTELTFPSLEGGNVKNSIAISNENSTKFGDLWMKYKQLIIDAAIATSESKIWYIGDCYYDHSPTKELIELLKQKGENPKENSQYRTIVKSVEEWRKKKEQEISENKESDIEFGECKCEQDTALLSLFWENNKRFLLALMNGLPEEEHKKIDCLTKEVSKRDNTKYRVYYAGECLNDKWLNKKSSNNSETAWLIIRMWAQEQKTTLDKLRSAFNPKNCNPAYENGKYFKNLFFEFNEKGKYEGEQGTNFENRTLKAGGWDFYQPKNDSDDKFLIEIEKGKKAIMLKFWKKEALNKLVKLVTSDNKYFKESLSIQSDKEQKQTK